VHRAVKTNKTTDQNAVPVERKPSRTKSGQNENLCSIRSKTAFVLTGFRFDWTTPIIKASGLTKEIIIKKTYKPFGTAAKVT